MTPAEFKEAMPTFKDVGDAVIQRWLDDSAADVSAARLGSRYNRALRYWVAHNIALENKWNQMGVTAKAGDVISSTTKDGSVSRSSSAVDAAIENPYLKTEFGQLYIEAVSGSLVGAVVSSSSRGYQGVQNTVNGDWDSPPSAGTWPFRRPGDFVSD